MKFWCMLLFIVTLIVLFPYIRCFFKRLKCEGKIKRLCRSKNYKIYATHPLWFLGSKHVKKCDLYIETENEVFSIKLFSMPKKSTVLVFKENGEYYVRKFVGMLSYGSAIQFPINSKPKLMQNYDFRYRYRDEWETKTPRRILLINPAPMEFRRELQVGSEVIVGAGGVVNGMEIDSLQRLLGDLECAL